MTPIKTLAVSTIAASALAMSACSSTNSVRDLSPTTKGAIAGATAGALIKSKGNRKDIAKGAAASAVLGGGTGYVIDKNK